jgi:hypothetical protein
MNNNEEKQQALKGGLYLVAQERIRQIEEEGYSLDHDRHEHDEPDALALAAACYAIPSAERPMDDFEGVPVFWPWDEKQWKPCYKDRIRELVKAGALICAEIDRIRGL